MNNNPRKPNDIYIRAETNHCYVDTNYTREEAIYFSRANKNKAIDIAVKAGIITPEQAHKEKGCAALNPYNHYKTNKHIIYVRDGIEYFIRVN